MGRGGSAPEHKFNFDGMRYLIVKLRDLKVPFAIEISYLQARDDTTGKLGGLT
jgi:hypothetical protein